MQMLDGCEVMNKDGTCRACYDGYKKTLGKCVRCRGAACISCKSDACNKYASSSYCGTDGFCTNCTELWPGISESCQQW